MMSEITEKLVKDLKTVVADIDLALSDMKGKTNNEIDELQESLKEKLATTKEMLIESEQDFLNKKEIAIEMTDSYTRDNSWKLIIIAAVIGFLLGYLA
jgi:ElaB/YqjD/DUF883 family membrane-anchored ribosome-binding protein